MCIVIDANVFSKVLCEKADPDGEFEPVRKWIIEGCGKIVFGGSTYQNELRRVEKALNVIKELKTRPGKVIIADSASVDELESAIKRIVSTKCDDPHLIAIVGVTRCPLICTQDKRAHEHIKNQSLYPWKNFKPSIYSCRENESLLSDENANYKCLLNRNQNSRFDAFVAKCGQR